MKKLIKLVLLVLVVLVVIVGVAIYRIDSIAKTAVESGASSALGVDTTLGDIRIALLAGNCSLDDLVVSNPKGFDTPHFMALGAGRVGVTLRSILEDTVELPELRLEGIDVYLEKKADGSNYMTILDNIKKLRGTDEEPQTPEEQAPGKKFVIRKLVIKDVTVHADVMQGARLPIHIDAIELNDVGSDSDKGVLLSDLSAIIMQAVFKAIVQHGAELLPGVIVNELGSGLEKLADIGKLGVEGVQQLSETAGKVIEQAGQAVKDVTKTVDDAGKAVDDLGKNLDDAGKDLEKGVNDLFDGLGGKKKDEQKK